MKKVLIVVLVLAVAAAVFLLKKSKEQIQEDCSDAEDLKKTDIRTGGCRILTNSEHLFNTARKRKPEENAKSVQKTNV